MTDQPEKPDMDYLTAHAYFLGDDAVTLTSRRVASVLRAWQVVRDNRRPDLPPLPGWTDLGEAAVGRKVVGLLLDAGWRPPTHDQIETAREWVGHGQRQFDTWWNSLTDDEKAEFLAYFSEHGEAPEHLQPPS